MQKECSTIYWILLPKAEAGFIELNQCQVNNSWLEATYYVYPCKKPLISVHVYHLLYPVCKIGLKLRQSFCYFRKKRTNLFPNLILYLTNLGNSMWNINCLHPHILSMDNIHGRKSYPSFQPWKTLSSVDDFHVQKFSPWLRSFRSWMEFSTATFSSNRSEHLKLVAQTFWLNFARYVNLCDLM